MAPYRLASAFRVATVRGHVKQGWAVSLGSLGEGGAYAVTGLMMAGFGAIVQAVGAAHRHRYRPILMAANTVVLVWAALVCGPLLVLRADVAGALSSDPAVVALAVAMFIVMAFIQIADGLQSIALGALRGLTDNRVPNAISITLYWAVALPLGHCVGFIMGFGPSGVLAGYAFGVLLAALILQARFWTRTRPT